MPSAPSEPHSPGRSRAADPALLRRLNLAAAMRAFLDASSLTVADIRSTVGVSRPTAEEMLASLLQQGFVREAAVGAGGERGAGRPARRYEAVPEYATVVGVDIGAHKVAVTVCDLRGQVLSQKRRAVDPQLGPKGRIGAAVRLAEASTSSLGIAWDQVDDLVCGITGAIANDSGVQDIRTLPAGSDLDIYSLPGFDQIEVATVVNDRFGREVPIFNDIHLAAIAEHWRGAAAHAQDLVYMHAGRRLGAAIMIDGRIHHGRHGLAASIGALKILGWPEAMQALDQESRRLTGSAKAEASSDDVLALFAAATAGNSKALETVEGVARALALGASTLSHAIDPDLVVLGGGMSRAGDALAAPFQQRFAETTLNTPEVRLSLLGDESVSLGAARVALDYFEARLLAVDV